MGHIWLIGMMGSGKTTAGELAARMLDRPFLDTDVIVELETDQTIPELFSESEETFREAEASAITSAALHENAVIATGGGSILSQDNVAVMQRTGMIVLLDVDAETVAERIQVDVVRPLLPTTESIASVMADRVLVYNNVAEHVIPTVGRRPEDVAKEVAACADM
jgi:shikimate kinase